jgi:hypothetical protein
MARLEKAGAAREPPRRESARGAALFVALQISFLFSSVRKKYVEGREE